MADFDFVTPRLATGAAVSSVADVDQLVAAGITVIIDCRGEFDDASLLATHPDLLYIWDGTPDDGQTKPPEWFEKGLKVALPALAQPLEKVYCHCAAGINRGPSMCAAIMMAWGLSPALTEQLIRQARPQVGLRYLPDAIAAVAALGYA
jgi:hypothetical protein